MCITDALPVLNFLVALQILCKICKFLESLCFARASKYAMFGFIKYVGQKYLDSQREDNGTINITRYLFRFI